MKQCTICLYEPKIPWPRPAPVPSQSMYRCQQCHLQNSRRKRSLFRDLHHEVKTIAKSSRAGGMALRACSGSSWRSPLIRIYTPHPVRQRHGAIPPTYWKLPIQSSTSLQSLYNFSIVSAASSNALFILNCPNGSRGMPKSCGKCVSWVSNGSSQASLQKRHVLKTVFFRDILPSRIDAATISCGKCRA